jgi:hypothetical protein
MTGNIWEKKLKPTLAGKAGAIAKGIFITGEPLVEYAEYLLRFNGNTPQEKLVLYTRVARSGITDKLYDKLKATNDPDLQAILAKGFKRAFEKAVDDHMADDTQQYAASAMRSHWRERREYVLEVASQAAELKKKFWMASEALETMDRVLERCDALKMHGWMKDER